MKRWVAATWAYVVSFFITPPPKKKIADVGKDVGYFSLRGSILEKLETHFLHAKRLKKIAPDSYHLFAKIGAAIVPSDALLFNMDRLPAWWKENKWPAFGAVATVDPINKEGREDDLYIKLAWFQKVKTLPWNVLRPNVEGEVFRVGLFFDDLDRGAEVMFHVHVAKDDLAITLLNELQNKRVRIDGRHGRSTSFNKKVWEPSRSLQYWWSDAGRERARKKLNLATIEDAAVRLFRMIISGYTETHTDIQVRVEKDELAVTFSIATKRTAYFFRDREIVVNEKGNRKRIFHVVRPHIRKTGKAVKMHFRGTRDFNWNNYRIIITVPGLHHASLYELSDGLHDMDHDVAKEIGMMSSSEYANNLANHVRGNSS